MSLVSEYVDSDTNGQDSPEGESKEEQVTEEKIDNNQEKEGREEKDRRDSDGRRSDSSRRRHDDRDRRRHDDRKRRDHRERDHHRSRSGDDRRSDGRRDRHKDSRSRDYRRRSDDDRSYHGNRGSRRDRDRREYGRGGGGRSNEDYLEYRRKKFGDNPDWGKATAESLKDVQTDSTLPSAFDGTVAKQLAAQREKRKLLWGSNKGEASTSQKTVWGAGALKDDSTGEQTAKFLKLMGVKDVTAENVNDYKADASVLRSSDAVKAMEHEYEKSRYMQHINKGIGLGLVQFNNNNTRPS